MSRFRAATYNIHKCRGMDWKIRPERIREVLEEIDTDLAAAISCNMGGLILGSRA